MIVTLTANPSHDRTVTLPGPLRRGDVQRVPTATVEPGGKGVNVARAASGAGVEAVAVFPAATGDPFMAELDAHDLRHVAVPVAEPVRTNLTLSEPDGTTTKVNEPGPTLSPAEVDALVDRVVEVGARARWLVLAGSLPGGAPDDCYATIVARLADADVRVAVDTSGGPLRALLDGDHHPDLIKPNAHELADLVGGDPDGYEADPALAARAARGLVDRGITTVLLTLGAAGTVVVTADHAAFAEPLAIEPRSTVGAGDSSLTGWLLADLAGHDLATRLRWATAWGAAAVSLPGTALPTPGLTRPEQVVVTSLSGRAPTTGSPTP